MDNRRVDRVYRRAAPLVMYLVSTFLFHFSSGQYRMGPVVDFGALGVVLGTLVLAAIVWRVRSSAAAVRWTVIATAVAWVAAIVIEGAFRSPTAPDPTL